MKKINSILKTIVALAIVLVMAQGCVPAGGTPTPTPNGFNINISTTFLVNSPLNNQQSKTLVIDGDSILFFTSVGNRALGAVEHDIEITPLTIASNYEYLTYSYLDATSLHSPIPILAGVTINNTIEPHQLWNNFGNSYQNRMYSIGGSAFLGIYVFLDLPLDQESYVVFRKLKPAGYQYYWVKVKYSTINLLGSLAYKLDIINCRYQMNSIVTGQ